MHPCDRDQLMDQLRQMESDIEELRFRLRETTCYCDRERRRECDVCAETRGLEIDLEDLERHRRELLQKFPEMRYG